MTDVYFSLPATYVKLLNGWHSEEKKCNVCNITYVEIHNIGKWACNQHTGDYFYVSFIFSLIFSLGFKYQEI